MVHLLAKCCQLLLALLDGARVDHEDGGVNALADCVSISKHCMAREYYKALMLCRKLIEYEDERLGNVASGVSTGGHAS